jgi:ankyrin repeat protein
VQGEEEPPLVELAGRLFDMARAGRGEELAAYVDAGVPVNLANDSGDTLLMLAAYHGHPEAVRALLGRGAEPDRANDRGQTPLAGAVFKGEDEIAALLVEAGADADAGHPSPRDAAHMFEQRRMLDLFG